MQEAEPSDTRLKRLRMRSMRRGIREMDLILTAFAAAELDRMADAEIATYERLLDESDHDLYAWVTGQTAPPERFRGLVVKIASVLQRN